ncbi:hypothetical protein BSLG_000389 [Batrachochytrium salamandrivorans]|nr:hypothetical protein BSLG_000389 [Batrachochytrium salamandrivorans]
MSSPQLDNPSPLNANRNKDTALSSSAVATAKNQSGMDVCVTLNPAAASAFGTRPRPLRLSSHPIDMQTLGLVAGDLVMVSTHQESKALGVVWPSYAVQEKHVLVSQTLLDTASMYDGGHATLYPVRSPAVVAARISLRWIHIPDFPIDEILEIYIKEILLESEYICCSQMIRFQYYGKERLCKVDHILPIDTTLVNDLQSQTMPFRVIRSTQVTLLVNMPVDVPEATHHGYTTVGGLTKQIATIRSLVELTLCHPERISCLGFIPPRGVLLFGPPGTGKTLIARTVANETKAHVITVNGSEVISRYYGEAESKLSTIFQEASEKSPSIIFLDEIDALCPKRDEGASEVQQRIVAALLTLMDGTNQDINNGDHQPRIIVIGATNRPNAIDDALRRPGRFDHEIEIGIPSGDDRFKILQAILRPIPNLLSDTDLYRVSSSAHGYVGADLAAVCREAGLKAIQRFEVESRSRGIIPNDDELHISDLKLTAEDLISGMAMVQPSAMREVILEVPKVPWTDIGGQDNIKQRLQEAVEWPLKNPEVFLRFNISPPKGILLYGPPGCSKTLMAKALATEAGLNFFAVKGPEDEIDALAVRRGGDDSSVADRVLSQLLNEMDGIEPLVNVTVVAATNRPDILDSALLRPGRIDSILYVAPPDLDSRKQIFRIQTNRMACSDDVVLNVLAEMTDGFSGAEVVSACQEAAMQAMEEDLDAICVSQCHFVNAIESITPRITQQMLKFYDDFRLRCGLRSV